MTDFINFFNKRVFTETRFRQKAEQRKTKIQTQQGQKEIREGFHKERSKQVDVYNNAGRVAEDRRIVDQAEKDIGKLEAEIENLKQRQRNSGLIKDIGPLGTKA